MASFFVDGVGIFKACVWCTTVNAKRACPKLNHNATARTLVTCADNKGKLRQFVHLQLCGLCLAGQCNIGTCNSAFQITFLGVHEATDGTTRGLYSVFVYATKIKYNLLFQQYDLIRGAIVTKDKLSELQKFDKFDGSYAEYIYWELNQKFNESKAVTVVASVKAPQPIGSYAAVAKPVDVAPTVEPTVAPIVIAPTVAPTADAVIMAAVSAAMKIRDDEIKAKAETEAAMKAEVDRLVQEKMAAYEAKTETTIQARVNERLAEATKQSPKQSPKQTAASFAYVLTTPDATQAMKQFGYELKRQNLDFVRDENIQVAELLMKNLCTLRDVTQSVADLVASEHGMSYGDDGVHHYSGTPLVNRGQVFDPTNNDYSNYSQ